MEQKSFEMSREQIDEMARDLENHTCMSQFQAEISSKILYILGYRKQKQGEWIAKDNFDGRCTIATCSSCGTEKAFAVLVRIETISTLYPYCQKCGAQMKGGA